MADLCVGHGDAGVVVPDVDDWKSYIKYPVPLMHQASSWSCGAASLMATFLYWLPDDYPYETEYEMWSKLNTTEKNGTEPNKMVKVAKKGGLNAEYHSQMTIESLREQYENGNTVIMCFQAWPGKRLKGWEFDWKDGHYAVLVGMDENNMFLMDPSTHGSYVWLPIDEMTERWHDVDEDREKKFGMGIVISGPSNHKGEFIDSLKRLC